MSDTAWIHRILDGQDGASARPGPGSEAGRQLAAYEAALALLAESRESPPETFVDEVMSRLPQGPGPAQASWTSWVRALWPGGARWVVPALSGALAALLLTVGLGRAPAPSAPPAPDDPSAASVTFELHAPGAREVELVGSFNGWRPGEIVLRGPDATGHWTATVRLPEGRHEYLYLVDGDQWVTDPRAVARRPDGFGRENAVIDL
ncbi:MAG: isoamylase early set domain-containing protein [Thermodesulfobacteriota bacterium]